MNRLNHLDTLKIRPDESVTIEYLGKPFQGAAGDTIATLLYGGGVRIFGRSLKYHRPRGLYSLNGECSNTLMAVDGEPNVRGETTEARNGMVVEPQNVKGDPARDLMGFMDKLSPVLPAGFYYKMFHKPASLWPKAIKGIRKAAGLGKISPHFTMKGSFDEIYLNADVCVIGGGPAGMAAALAASQAGLRVILLESRPWLGGFFDYRPGLYDRGRSLADRVETDPNIRVFTRTSVIGSYTDNLITAFCRGDGSDAFDERYLEIRAKSVVTSTGCIERPLLFAHNERPGVMQISCAHRLIRTWGILPGTSAVFSIGDDLGLEAALDLADLGMEIQCVADVREDGQNEALADRLAEKGIPLFRGWVAAASDGDPKVKRVSLTAINGVRSREFECDLIVAGAGQTPVTGPLTLAGAKQRFDRRTGFFLPVDLPRKMHAAGRMLGYIDPDAIEASGDLAGVKAAADCNGADDSKIREAEERLGDLQGPARGTKFIIGPVKTGKTFICFDEDTTVKNVDQAIAGGFDVPELIKRFTAAGTGPGQGGIPGHNLPLYVGLTGQSPDLDPRPTTVRPPLTPTLIAAYAGSNHDMSKRTPMHEEQVKAGGRMERVGVWHRARRFGDDAAAAAEIENVRNNVGILDASTLGKFRIFGPDVLKALDRVYVGSMSRVKSDRMLYSAMCNEDGCIIDDGVLVKRGENDYYFTTSTGRAGSSAEWIRYHTRYENWDFHIVNLTDAFGVINLAGPNARKTLEKVADADLSNDAFPFMGYREFSIKEIPVRAMRLGFVGELSFELHVASSWMPALWKIIEEAGAEFGIRHFGLEAQNVLRMEKGHLIIGSESEQRTTLHDVGLGFLWHKEKREADTVGAAALRHTENQEGRLKLVGIEAQDPQQTPRDGSIIVDEKIRGYVATARYSRTLEKSVGMALVESELADIGTQLEIFEGEKDDERLAATVVPMPFYDPEGRRLRM